MHTQGTRFAAACRVKLLCCCIDTFSFSTDKRLVLHMRDTESDLHWDCLGLACDTS